MITKKQTDSLTKAIDKFNKDLNEYFRVSEENELPDIDTTCIGFSPAQPYITKS